MKILYVEDTLLNLCLVERIARMGSHEVINYASAEQALHHFEQDRPDLLLVDIRLDGEMSGVELIQRLRSAGHQQPVVVITAIITDEMPVGRRKRLFHQAGGRARPAAYHPTVREDAHGIDRRRAARTATRRRTRRRTPGKGTCRGRTASRSTRTRRHDTADRSVTHYPSKNWN
jgi:CheY-like chemotaxis protein